MYRLYVYISNIYDQCTINLNVSYVPIRENVCLCYIYIERERPGISAVNFAAFGEFPPPAQKFNFSENSLTLQVELGLHAHIHPLTYTPLETFWFMSPWQNIEFRAFALLRYYNTYLSLCYKPFYCCCEVY
jgi:hypothetical protein